MKAPIYENMFSMEKVRVRRILIVSKTADEAIVRLSPLNLPSMIVTFSDDTKSCYYYNIQGADEKIVVRRRITCIGTSIWL